MTSRPQPVDAYPDDAQPQNPQPPNPQPQHIRPGGADTVRGPRRPVGRLPLWAAVLLLVVLVLLATAASLMIGARPLSPATTWAGLFHPVPGNGDHAVVQSRIPRTLTGLLIGLALGLAGAGIQGITRNPLGDPGILGVNAGAALGVVGGISILGISSTGGRIVSALIGAAVASVLVYAIAASGRGGATPVKLAIAGAALSVALFGVMRGLLLVSRQTLEEFRHWQVGNLTTATLTQLGQVLPFIVVGAVVLLAGGRVFNLFAMGDDVAASLGLPVGLARIVTSAAVVLLCGSATALVGPIAFVGLLVPHAVRALVGSNYHRILLLSALGGPVIVLLADTVGRVILLPSEVAVGVMTALIGAPLLILILRTGRQVQL